MHTNRQGTASTGPGSGKTKTITVKIARLLAEDVHRPRRLACITYSNACVGELRSRLTKLGAGTTVIVSCSPQCTPFALRN